MLLLGNDQAADLIDAENSCRPFRVKEVMPMSSLTSEGITVEVARA